MAASASRSSVRNRLASRAAASSGEGAGPAAAFGADPAAGPAAAAAGRYAPPAPDAPAAAPAQEPLPGGEDDCADLAVDFLKAKNLGRAAERVYLEQNYVVKSFGTQLLLEHISADLGLTALLRQVFPDIWTEILTLAFYLISENDYLRYCSDWLDNVEGLLPSESLSIGRIEQVLASITESRRLDFFRRWAN
ncbi:MAG: hypothetical protein LBD70_04775, partial [Bifidobacteriaceae bacterium]|nr:hypothetical protein [Bifidobacteriaceae bacterium]